MSATELHQVALPKHTAATEIARQAIVTRLLPEAAGYNRSLYEWENSLAYGDDFPKLTGFNAPLGLDAKHAKNIAALVGDVFKLTPEPEYIRIFDRPDRRLGVLEKFNSCLPQEKRLKLRNELGAPDPAHSINLAEFGMLGGAEYVPNEPMTVVLALTTIACGLKSDIQAFLAPRILQAVGAYCRAENLGAPTSVQFTNQFSLFESVKAEAIQTGLTPPLENSLSHSYLWLSPEGTMKIEKWLALVAPHLRDLSPELLGWFATLQVNVALNKRLTDFMRGRSFTQKIGAELFTLSGKWREEEEARIGVRGMTGSFYTTSAAA